jgi:multiple sugar transport system substrate-binding protein
MNALYPLPDSFKETLGSREDFIPQSWDSCFLFGNPQLWAVPWISETRIIYYRKDLLARAGLDPAQAFASFESLLETLARLSAAGVDCPWAAPTLPSLNTLHVLNSWIWGHGADLISRTGRQLLFTEENALTGMELYFQLGRYLGPKPRWISYEQAETRFWSGQAAVTVDGSWMYARRRKTAQPLVLANLGFAPLPGPAFVGGSDLVIWARSPNKETALELLRYLSEPQAVLSISRLTGLAPSRLNLLASATTGGDEFQDVISQAFATGRTLPNTMFTAMLEDRLLQVFGEVWSDVLDSAQENLRAILLRHLEPLRMRMQKMINS